MIVTANLQLDNLRDPIYGSMILWSYNVTCVSISVFSSAWISVARWSCNLHWQLFQGPTKKIHHDVRHQTLRVNEILDKQLKFILFVHEIRLVRRFIICLICHAAKSDDILILWLLYIRYFFHYSVVNTCVCTNKTRHLMIQICQFRCSGICIAKNSYLPIFISLLFA
jgi:hypothetical protein